MGAKDPDDSLCILSMRVLLNLNSGSDRGYCLECIDRSFFLYPKNLAARGPQSCHRVENELDDS